jgi:hypothetical protein
LNLERNRAWIAAANRHTVGQFARFDSSLCKSTTPQPTVIPLNGGKERLGPFFASFLLDKLEKQYYYAYKIDERFEGTLAIYL